MRLLRFENVYNVGILLKEKQNSVLGEKYAYKL